jgi:hypothetical protein
VAQWRTPQFITLTFKNDVSTRTAEVKYDEFSNYLNKKIYKHAYKRYHKFLAPFVIKEGQRRSAVKVHFHTIYELPHTTSQSDFRRYVTDLWKDNGTVHFEEVCEEEKLASYVLKSRTKNLKKDDLIYKF